MPNCSQGAARIPPSRIPEQVAHSTKGGRLSSTSNTALMAQGELDEDMTGQDVRVYLTSFDLGTVQYVAGVVIGREDTIFFKQGTASS
ncbi:uncharacterized protein JCM15063_005158 [Sporobolomyces koalae]|uniref:uncharacterized protein n=1 Tax=Sporobolomyces koalae TaxID=500713 RepID=UPI00317E4F9D